MSHTVLAGVSLLALLGAAAGCANDTTTDSADQSAADGTPAAATKKKPAVDSCTLLKADEVKKIIGANSGAKPGGGVGESTCSWENEDNYHSLTVAIGNAKTAPGGKLSKSDTDGLPGAGKAEAGPDGIVFAADNTATFAAGDRECYVQVVTDPTSTKDRDVAVRLIKLIRTRTEGKL
ncbi:DUF3558 family protein [Actinoplanes sp. L3-i22]|uniref:DUF3558 family protein n=1 Tax=Actinoplanes sp. L3-i22 TaxID=2836373 RepID=UPI001C74A531|nr:DUF3558 family protein [Actinoplanes sp. L3-i22]BCY09694.1 hypothetical protein L3i22_047820 [Actinoplanes sp. L3-i22]